MKNIVDVLRQGNLSEFSEIVKDTLMGKAYEEIEARRTIVASTLFTDIEGNTDEEVQ